jgi:carbon-monoxide dehydrogenase medium subunit
VYPAAFEYFAPETIEEALSLLAEHGGEAKILAGGQSLVPMMKLRIASPAVIIDLNRIAALTGCARAGDRLELGALCRHAEILASPLVRQQLPLMFDAASQTADVQVRNRGTVGGSLAHADPAGDWPAALLALDTRVTMVGAGGVRTIALDTFVLDAYTTALDPTELLTGISIGIPGPGSGGAYVKFEKRAGDFAVASIGVQVTLDGERCTAAAVSLGALGAKPVRARAAEDVVTGQCVSDALLENAARLVEEACDPFADTRGSVEYKRSLAGVLFRRAFDHASRRARGEVLPPLHL